jgi:hypothetical protein
MWSSAKQYAQVRPGGILSEELDSFSVPAREPAYDFKVTVYCARRPTRRRRHRWQAEKAELIRAYEIVRETVRLTAGQFSIFDPGMVEQAINERLADRLDGAKNSDRSLISRWTTHAEVVVPNEVLALMRRTVEEEYEVRAKAQVSALRMTKTNELRVGWDRFLNDAAESRNAHHAVHLAEHSENIAQILAQVLQDRGKDAADLLTVINKIVEAHRQADILDLVVNSESVLRQTLKLIGIPLPEMDADSLLAPLEEEA